MSAGTLTLTNGSASVIGDGTAFGTENKIGDFIVGYINGQSYSLAIASIESPTALTLTEVFYGPTTASVPWDSVPLRAITAIPYQLGVQHLKTLRLMNLESDNWLQMYTSPGDITVNLPDDRQYHGPSILKVGNSLDNKADKTALGNSSSRNVGTTAGTVAAGDDSRITGAMQKTGGTVDGNFDFTGTTTLNGQKNVRFKGFRDTSKPEGANNNDLVISTPTNPGAGAYACQLVYQWYADGWITGIKRNAGYGTNSFGIYFNGASTGSGREWNFNVDGNAYGGQWVNSCDIRHKSKLVPVENPLSAVLSFRGMTFDVKDGARSVGLIAQDVERWCPEAIKVYGDRTFSDGTVIKDFKYIDSTGVSSAYHTEAIRELFGLIELALNDPDLCRSRIADIKELVTTSEASS